MKNFAELFLSLDRTNKTKEKVALLKSYFEKASSADQLWALALFSHRRPKSPVNGTQLRQWAIEASGMPPWLFEECYHVTGDIAEAIALLLPFPEEENRRTLSEWIDFIRELSRKSEEEKKLGLQQAWKTLSQQERLVFNKILTGGFRVGVSQNLLVQALSELTGIEKSVIAHRLMGNWDPSGTSLDSLLHTENKLDDISRPYPFALAYALDQQPASLGSVEEWQVEWKWDGIRAQVIKRGEEFFIWSRGEELITDKFPELLALKAKLPDNIVLDGELLPYKEGRPLPFNILQTRIGRKNLSSKILEEAPAALIMYDIMEYEGEDIRTRPLSERRELLEEIERSVASPLLRISGCISSLSWEELAALRERSREFFAEGFMLKRKTSPYGVGRKRGDWWKWKIEPLSVDGVLIYAQKGNGKRADLYTDYTFGVWHEGTLVPFAKAYSGLTDEEIRKVDYFVKRHTLEKFGPVRTVTPELVFEIGFENILESKRHKSGVAVRFPRILRWRIDKKAEEADTLEGLRSHLKLVH